jgi:2-methylcitrate dehydratase
MAEFEGRHGYIEIMEGKAGPMNLEPFGTWAVRRTNLKFFPATANTQIGIWCAKELRKGLDLTQLSEIMLHTSRFLWHESGREPAKWVPTTHETADHRLPYTFTMALLVGSDHTVAQRRPWS